MIVRTILREPSSRGPRAAAVVVVVVAALSFGCGLIPPQNPVDFCAANAARLCALQFSCCDARERQDGLFGINRLPAFQRNPASNAGECEATVVELCRAGAAMHNESVQDERIIYDADEAQDCLDDLDDAVDDCELDDFFEAQGTYVLLLMAEGKPGLLGRGCDNALEGEGREGDDCVDDSECRRGACVVGDPDDPDDEEGQTLVLEGECQGDFQRSPGFDSSVRFDLCDGPDEDD